MAERILSGLARSVHHYASSTTEMTTSFELTASSAQPSYFSDLLPFLSSASTFSVTRTSVVRHPLFPLLTLTESSSNDTSLTAPAYTGSGGPDPNLLADQIQAFCPICKCTVTVIRLRADCVSRDYLSGSTTRPLKHFQRLIDRSLCTNLRSLAARTCSSPAAAL